MNVIPLRAVRVRDEREFMPAALEIVETPASPAGRALIWLIILFFAFALAWASLGRVDIIATATGKIVPTGRTKVIQPLEIGVVREVHVREGQSVKAGDILVELDPTDSAADRDRFVGELLTARLDAARLRGALSTAADPTLELIVPPGASAEQAEYNYQLLTSQVGEHRAKLASLDRQRAKEEANRAAVAGTVQKLSVALPLLRQRMEARKYLYEKEIGSKLTYLEVAQDLAEHEQELLVQRHRLVEADSAVAGIAEQRRQAEAEYRRTVLTDLAQADQKAKSLAEELVKAEQRHHRQTLTAPVDGVVQQIAVHTVGGVVTPAQPLMVVVPADSRLEIEAMVKNQDIGFVRAGEPAEIKVDTFNFTRYGLMHGNVTSVSQDAMVREKPPAGSAASAGADDTSARSASDGSQASGQELVYTARVSLDRTQMEVEDRVVNLAPGMAVTVEIKTGSRRVIEYLLSPLLRYKQEAMRER